MNDPSPVPRSAFVTSIAWSFIVLAGLGIAWALLQNIVFNVMVGTLDIETVINDARSAGAMPDMLALVFRNMRWLLLLTLILSVLTLIASIALLRRRNWARLAFIVMMWLGVAGNLGGLWLQYQLLSGAPVQEMLKTMTGAAGIPMDDLVQSVEVVSALVAVVFAALFAWAAIRLNLQEIKDEFSR
jgi:hypothetical protein